LKLINIIVVFNCYIASCLALSEETCHEYNWDFMNFHYNNNINDFCCSMVKRDLEHIYNYRCETEYKKASTTCDEESYTKIL